MKKLAVFVAAIALTLGLAQCKKEQTPTSNTGESVFITLNVGDNNNGTRVNVDPTGTNQVTFENGDQILVAYDGKYVGTLERSNSQFSGEITITQNGNQPLYFYFLGNKTPDFNSDNSECSVNISDQTTTAGLPVISMGRSLKEDGSVLDYVDGMTSFTSRLYNKCSLMKFNVTTPSTAAICITGMNNKVTVEFGKKDENGTGLGEDATNNGFSYSMDATDGGLIKMPAKDTQGVTWAIVLPQVALPAGAQGSAYTEGNVGTRPAIHAIESNKYYHEGNDVINMSVNIWNGDLSKLSDGDSEEYTTATDGMTVYGTLAANVKISIADGANVTLQNANITGVNNSSYSWAGLNCLGDANINLSGTNTVKGFDSDYPGIHIAENKTLTISGDGSLHASSNGWAAGIGGGYCINCGNINISGGNITALGGTRAAGIGAGAGASCGDITITNGSVTGQGGPAGAGIGTGVSFMSNSVDYNSTCGDISISGGEVNATGGLGAAGIGTGFGYSKSGDGCNSISITGGTVTAVGGNGGTISDIMNGGNYNYDCPGGAGIGTGSVPPKKNINCGHNQCGDITIGTGVTFVSASKGSGDYTHNSIGKNTNSTDYGGYGLTCGVITIGGTVYYNGQQYLNNGYSYLQISPLEYQPQP